MFSLFMYALHFMNYTLGFCVVAKLCMCMCEMFFAMSKVKSIMKRKKKNDDNDIDDDENNIVFTVVNDVDDRQTKNDFTIISTNLLTTNGTFTMVQFVICIWQNIRVFFKFYPFKCLWKYKTFIDTGTWFVENKICLAIFD